MKKVFISFLLSIALIPTIKPMQSLGSKLGQWTAKSIAKKSFSGFMTGLHWTIAAGLPIGWGSFGLAKLYQESELLKHYEDKIDTIFEGTNEATENSIKSKLRAMNTPVKLVSVLNFPMMPIGSFSKTILIDSSVYQEFEEAIEQNDKVTQNRLLGCIEHELSHIRNNDHVKRFTACLTFPFITHLGLKKINTYIPSSIKIQSFIGKQCMKIPSAFAKLAVILAGISLLSHYQEQRADNEVSNNPDMLNGMKNSLQTFEFIEKNLDNDPNIPFLKKKKQIAFCRFFHPSPTSRIKKLDKRIQAIEQSAQK